MKPTVVSRLFVQVLSLSIFSACIEFREDLDTNRNVTVVDVAPQPDITAGTRQKFALMLNDPFDAPGQLTVYGKIDGMAEVRCRLDSATNTIDETREESIFRCPFDNLAIPSGARRVAYRVVNRDGYEAVARSVAFTYDAEPPVLDAAMHTDVLGNLLTWTVADESDFREVSVFLNGVRILSSFAHEGSARLDAGVVANGANVEVRAYDLVRNMAMVEL